MCIQLTARHNNTQKHKYIPECCSTSHMHSYLHQRVAVVSKTLRQVAISCKHLLSYSQINKKKNTEHFIPSCLSSLHNHFALCPQAAGEWTWCRCPRWWPAHGTWPSPRSSAALWPLCCWPCWSSVSSTARDSCWRRSPVVSHSTWSHGVQQNISIWKRFCRIKTSFLLCQAETQLVMMIWVRGGHAPGDRFTF